MDELEFVLRRIVEIDHKVNDLQSKAKKTMEDQEMALLQKLNDYDDERMEDIRKDLEIKYHHALERAEKQARQIQENTERQCRDILDHYKIIKSPLKEAIFNELTRG